MRFTEKNFRSFTTSFLKLFEEDDSVFVIPMRTITMYWNVSKKVTTRNFHPIIRDELLKRIDGLTMVLNQTNNTLFLYRDHEVEFETETSTINGKEKHSVLTFRIISYPGENDDEEDNVDEAI